MEMNIFYKLAFLSLFSIALLPLIIGAIGKCYGKDLFGSTLIACIFGFIIFLISGLVYEVNSKITLNDVTIDIHYVDGYSERITKKGLMDSQKPYIRNSFGGYVLYFGGDKYPGVIRYDYVSKKSYQIDYSDYNKR